MKLLILLNILMSAGFANAQNLDVGGLMYKLDLVDTKKDAERLFDHMITAGETDSILTELCYLGDAQKAVDFTEVESGSYMELKILNSYGSAYAPTIEVEFYVPSMNVSLSYTLDRCR